MVLLGCVFAERPEFFSPAILLTFRISVCSFGEWLGDIFTTLGACESLRRNALPHVFTQITTKQRLRYYYLLHSFSRSRCRPTAPSADRVRYPPKPRYSILTMMLRSAALPSSSSSSSSSSSFLRKSALLGRRRLPAVRGAAASALANGGGNHRCGGDGNCKGGVTMLRHHSSAALRQQRERPHRDVDDIVDRDPSLPFPPSSSSSVVVVDDEPDYASLGPTSRLNLFTAINSAMRTAMRTDRTAIVFGEDVGFGGVFRCSQDLSEEFGKDRVFNTPLSENGIAVSAWHVFRIYCLFVAPKSPFIAFAEYARWVPRGCRA